MTIKEFTAKTTEEAISEGLRVLGCTLSDVKVEVIEEGSKGLFGLFGSRPAKVRLTVLNEEDEKDDMSDLLSSFSLNPQQQRKERPAKAAPKAEAKAEVKPEAPKAEKTEKVEKAEPVKAEKAPKAEAKPEVKVEAKPEAPKTEKIEKAEKTEKTESKPKAPKAKAEKPEKAFAPVPERTLPELPSEPPVMHDPATPMGCAQQFLMEVTQRMNVPVQVYVDTLEDGTIYVRMVGDTLGILIGRRGETLDALQYLTSLQVNKESDDYLRVTLDTENYRARREDSLRRLAARMAQKAVKTGRKVSLEPMNPYERRVLHAALQSHPSVTTHSEGEEPNRHVVITLKGAEKDGAEASEKPARTRPPRKRGSRGRGPRKAHAEKAAETTAETVQE